MNVIKFKGDKIKTCKFKYRSRADLQNMNVAVNDDVCCVWYIMMIYAVSGTS